MELSSGSANSLPGKRLSNIKYWDDIVFLRDETQIIKTAFNQSTVGVHEYGIYFAPFKCEVPLRH